MLIVQKGSNNVLAFSYVLCVRDGKEPRLI